MVGFGLYIHIPFCIKKCFYCDFNSIPVGKKEGDESISRYMRVLCAEIESYKALTEVQDYQVKSVFIGGGTPSIVCADEIGKVLKVCKRIFKLAEDAEISIEVNPGTVSSDSLNEYKKFGINRISFGCQSFNDNELKAIGRIHKAEDIYRSFEMARKAGFENIGIDLIFGIPEQSLESFKANIKKVISLKPQHISLYNLTVENDTPFYYLLKKGELNLPEEEEQIAMYEYGIKALKKNGFEYYEISNFAIDGKRCCHNENYWRAGEYLGFGAGAHSFLKVSGFRFQVSGLEYGKRWWNMRDVGMYCKGVERQIPSNPPLLKGGWGDSKKQATYKIQSIVDGEEFLDREKLISEAMMLGLRMIEGIDLKAFYEKYGVVAENKYKKEIEELKRGKLIELKDEKLRLTHKGILFSDEVFLRFIS